MTRLDPYAPPRDDDDDDAPPWSDARRRFEIAGRGARLGGAFIDGVMATIVSYMIRSFSGDAEFFPTNVRKLKIDGLYFVAIAVPLAFQAALIARSGQSLGKMVLRTRIVDEEGRTAKLFQAFVLRTLPLTAIALTPSLVILGGADLGTFSVLGLLVGLVSLIDALLIFGTDNRTLHDRIAGTYVCVVGTQRILEEEARARKKKRRKRKTAA